MSSSSKSASKTSTDTTNSDERIVADNGAVVVRNGDAIITDGGAFDLVEAVTLDAFGMAEGVADLGAEFAFDALGFVQSNQQSTNAIVEKALDQTRDEATQLMSQFLRIGVPAIALVLIFRGYKA